MHILYIILAVIVIAVLIWWQIKIYRSNPDMYSKKNITKSMYSLGVLALGLIVFVIFLVFVLKGK